MRAAMDFSKVQKFTILFKLYKTANFGLHQIERFYKLNVVQMVSKIGKKTLCEKKKKLVHQHTCIFISPNSEYVQAPKMIQMADLFHDRVENNVGKGEISCYFSVLRKLLFGSHLTHSHTMTPFDTPGKQAF